MTDEEKVDKHTIEYWLQFIKENNDDVADFNFGFSKIIEIAKQLEKENAKLKAMEKVWVDFSKFDFCEDTYKHFLFKLENGKEYCGYMTEDVADGDCCFGLTYFKDNTLKSVDDWGFITSIEGSKITHFMKVEN